MQVDGSNSNSPFGLSCSFGQSGSAQYRPIHGGYPELPQYHYGFASSVHNAMTTLPTWSYVTGGEMGCPKRSYSPDEGPIGPFKRLHLLNEAIHVPADAIYEEQLSGCKRLCTGREASFEDLLGKSYFSRGLKRTSPLASLCSSKHQRT